MKFFAAILLCFLLFKCATSDANSTIELNSYNHVLLRNEVSAESINKLTLELAEAVDTRGDKSYPIYLVLDSPGGDIDVGQSFIEYAKTIPNLHTVTIFAASMAAGIVEALPGKRYIIETGVLMFHRAKGGVSGQFESGEMESRLDFYKKIVRNMEQKNADRMNMSLDTYKSKVKDEYWILGSEAVSKKAADEEINIKCSPTLLKMTSTENFTVMGMFTVKVTFSNCPLLRKGSVEGKNEQALYLKYRKEKYAIAQ